MYKKIIIAIIFSFLFYLPVKADPNTNDNVTIQTKTFSIGFLPEETSKYLRVPYTQTFCMVPDLEISLESGVDYEWNLTRETSSGFVITVTRNNSGYRESMRYIYVATGYLSCDFSTTLFLPLISK